MASRLSRNNVRKCCALVAAELILPPLAHAGKHRALFENDDNRWGDYDRAKENGASRWGDHGRDQCPKDRPHYRLFQLSQTKGESRPAATR